jgi:hypothetical protein
MQFYYESLGPGQKSKPFNFTASNQESHKLNNAATLMHGVVPQFVGTAVGAGVFLALSHSNISFDPCMYLHCEMDLKFELTVTNQKCGLSPHYERLCSCKHIILCDRMETFLVLCDVFLDILTISKVEPKPRFCSSKRILTTRENLLCSRTGCI